MTRSAQPETGFVKVNGTQLYYETLGQGQDDPRLFKDADKLEQDIAGAKRVTIPATHHMPNMEKPEEFNAIVLDFLKPHYSA